MSARNFGRVSVALMAFFMVAVFGNWDMQQGGTGFTLLAQAQGADNKDKDDDRDDFDHFACYEVACFKFDKGYYVEQSYCPAEGDIVQLFNQFTASYGKDYGVQVKVKGLKLLCAPTKKDHKSYKDSQD